MWESLGKALTAILQKMKRGRKARLSEGLTLNYALISIIMHANSISNG